MALLELPSEIVIAAKMQAQKNAQNNSVLGVSISSSCSANYPSKFRESVNVRESTLSSTLLCGKSPL
jgi:hypothetical protein